jgi:hypothetical protein
MERLIMLHENRRLKLSAMCRHIVISTFMKELHDGVTVADFQTCCERDIVVSKSVWRGE